jgi:hypothetical protein
MGEKSGKTVSRRYEAGLSDADLLGSRLPGFGVCTGTGEPERRRQPMPKAQIKDEKTYRKLRKGES